jgi:hypothetical protein
MSTNFLTKPSRTARKIAKLKGRKELDQHERTQKAKARKRDGGRCRFPLCGCRALKLPPRVEVSHDRHKGMGGNPAGDRSTSAGLITLCDHRHQHGVFSRHKGTLRTRYLTDDGNDGPVAWDLDGSLLDKHIPDWMPPIGHILFLDNGAWVQIATETSIGILARLSPWQSRVLKILAEMEL